MPRFVLERPSILRQAEGGPSVEWTFGFNSTEQNPVIPNAGLSQGSVTVTVTSPGMFLQTIRLWMSMRNPVPNITGSTSFCVGRFTVLNAGFGFSAYLWNTGGTTEDLYVDQSGTYSVTVSDGNGCTGVDEVEVKVGTVSARNNRRHRLCDGASGTLHAGNGFASYFGVLRQRRRSRSIVPVYSVSPFRWNRLYW